MRWISAINYCCLWLAHTMNLAEAHHRLQGSPYEQIPMDALFKVVIDANRWDEADRMSDPKKLFDRDEPGYMDAMIGALAYSLEQPNILTVEGIEALHDQAVSGVTSFFFPQGLPQKYRAEQSTVLIAFGSQKGYEEWAQKQREEPSLSIVAIDDAGNEYIETYNIFKNVSWRKQDRGMHVRLHLWYAPNWIGANWIDRTPFLQRCIQFLIKQYQCADKSEEEDALRAIVTLIQALDQIHPFKDGNIRTFAILLLNRLLIDNGLSPCCLWNPNHFDLCPINTLIAEVLRGQERFLQLRN